MRYYFTIQYKRLSRWLREMGVHAWVGILGMGMIFLGFSWYLFFRTEWASWLYAGIAVVVISRLSGAERTEDMRRMCKGMEYRRWRIEENVGGGLPFVIYLLYERQWGVAMGLLSALVAMSFITFKPLISSTIPTPFRKIPFEAIIGFRKTIPMLFILFVILLKAVQVENFNLGLVILAGTYLIQLSYYLIAENDYFVWIFSLDVKSFLKKKWAFAQKAALVISLPYALVLGVFNAENIVMIIAAVVIGHLWISAAVFAKYATFPKEMNVAQSFIFALSIIFFPFLVLLIPVYIKRSCNSLQLYLK